MADGGAAAVEGPIDVDREEPPPLLVGDAHQCIEGRHDPARCSLRSLLLRKRSDARDVRRSGGAGIVDEDVQAAELLDDALDGGVDRGAVADVDLEGQPVPELAHGVLCRL